MIKKKLKHPRWFRIIRYYLNCLWYYVLFPLGAELDEFSQQLNDSNKKE